MSFRPAMSAFTSGIHATEELVFRAWSGVVADLWCAEGRARGHGHYVSPDPRVMILLDSGPSPLRLGPALGNARPARVKAAFVPAGVALRSEIVAPGPFRHLDLHFDTATLRPRLGATLGPAAAEEALARPVLAEELPAADPLARQLADEVAAPRHDDLLPDSLALAILTLLLGLPYRSAETVARRGGLTPAQLSRVTGLMRGALDRRLPIREMAAASGLSESWFARAFRESTGETPHRHFLRLRVEAAARHLGDPAVSIAEAASATGFADQAHMTRAFRSVLGTTPGTWRRSAR